MKISYLLFLIMTFSAVPALAARDPFPAIPPSGAVTASSNIYSVAVSPNEKYIAAGAYGEVVVWSATGDLLQTLHFTGALQGVWVSAVVFSPDGSKIAAIGVDDGIRVWETETGKPLFQLPDHQKGALCVAFSRDGATLATGGNDKLVKLWNVQTGEKLCELEKHGFPVRKLCFSADGKTLVSQGVPAVISAIMDAQAANVEFVRWDVSDPKNATLRFGIGGDFYRSKFGCLGGGGDVSAGQGGRFVAVLPEGGTQIGAWRTSTGHQIWAFPDSSTLVDFAMTDNGRTLFCSGAVYDERLHIRFAGGQVLNAETGQEVARLRINAGMKIGRSGGFSVNSSRLYYPDYPLAVSPSGHIVAIAHTRTVYLWFLK